VDRYFPSSKTCYDCGYINQSLGENDRKWNCPICNVYHDRDHNASLNILKQGLSDLGIKSELKQKRGEALRMVSGKTERVIKSKNHEIENQSGRETYLY
jgi:putative transposase